MSYERLKEKLEENSTGEFAEFQKRIVCTNKRVIGVKTPVMRKMAKELSGGYYEVKNYPSDIYEVCFIRLAAAEKLPYDELIRELDFLLSTIDTWALTDSFKPKAVRKNKEDFKRIIERLIVDKREFYSRYALVAMLSFYRDKEDLNFVFSMLERCDMKKYYVSMAAAWLTAEIIILYYDEGLEFFKTRLKDEKTRERTVRKVKDSFRLSKEQKREVSLLL